MYDLLTKGRLVETDFNFNIVRVIADSVSVRSAFTLCQTIGDASLAMLVPHGTNWDGGELADHVLQYMPACDLVTFDGSDLDAFGYGQELTGEDYHAQGFSRAVWEDGNARLWLPAD